jgi:DNA repair ATPase RecN
VHSVVRRHREELTSDEVIILSGDELHISDVVKTTTPSDGGPESYPQGRSHLRVLNRRAVQNIAMLLRDSDVARRVRTYLLESEQSPRTVIASDPRYDGLDLRVTNLGSSMARIDPALQELGPVLRRMSVRLEARDHRMEVMDHRIESMDHRLEAVDRRLDATNRVVGAMSVRLADLSEDVAELKRQWPAVPRQRRK